jgi:hypothetical protein
LQILVGVVERPVNSVPELQEMENLMEMIELVMAREAVAKALTKMSGLEIVMKIVMNAQGGQLIRFGYEVLGD